MAKTSELILNALRREADAHTAEGLRRFFKTGPGQYGEGDLFLGVKVPGVRALVKRFAQQARLADVRDLLYSPYHEARLCGLFILVAQFEKNKDAAAREKIVSFYLTHLPRANNWDLIDLSVYKILGAHLYGKKDKSVLLRLASSGNLWEQRASIVATMYLVKRGDFEMTLLLAEQFLTHPHDLMHKAVGWLLREVGKKDESVLCDFLDRFAVRMPRTALRYCLEKLPPARRAHYMRLR